MKRLCLIFLIVGLTTSYANSSKSLNKISNGNAKNFSLTPHTFGIDFVQQDRTEMAFDAMMNELTRVHKAVYTLPYEFSFIKSTIMDEVEKNKVVIAPHFPNRSSYGEDAVLGRTLFKDWFINYPAESSAYIKFVDQVVLKYSK